MKLLDERVTQASHVGERGDNDVLETNLFNLLVNFPLVLDGMSSQLTDRALTQGIVQNEQFVVFEVLFLF